MIKEYNNENLMKLIQNKIEYLKKKINLNNVISCYKYIIIQKNI